MKYQLAKPATLQEEMCTVQSQFNIGIVIFHSKYLTALYVNGNTISMLNIQGNFIPIGIGRRSNTLKKSFQFCFESN